jgi:N-acetylglucosaminyl-diphospho-decaprenol L-rhamnosyltransferase
VVLCSTLTSFFKKFQPYKIAPVDRAAYLSKNIDVERHIVFSIVSHGQLWLIKKLLCDLRRLDMLNLTIILTINIPEDESCLAEFSDLPLIIVRNSQAKGFGENHNQAFEKADCAYFVIVNPDIRLQNFSIELMLLPFTGPAVGAVAPQVLSPDGGTEDSVRRYPTISRLLKRVVLRQREADYAVSNQLLQVDWAAGMFVVFRRSAFEAVGGFDTRYFMYMEDADVCRRLKLIGWQTILQPATSVIHDAQRASRKSFRHLRWHLASAIRFLCLPPKQTSSVECRERVSI